MALTCLHILRFSSFYLNNSSYSRHICIRRTLRELRWGIIRNSVSLAITRFPNSSILVDCLFLVWSLIWSEEITWRSWLFGFFKILFNKLRRRRLLVWWVWERVRYFLYGWWLRCYCLRVWGRWVRVWSAASVRHLKFK